MKSAREGMPSRTYLWRRLKRTSATMALVFAIIIMVYFEVVSAASPSSCPSASSSPASLLQGSRALRKDKNDAAANACLRQTAASQRPHALFTQSLNVLLSLFVYDVILLLPLHAFKVMECLSQAVLAALTR
jgi:hypothetical protein